MKAGNTAGKEGSKVEQRFSKVERKKLSKNEKLFQDIVEVKFNLLTYLAITTCYRSWPQLICGAIQYELL